MVHITLHIQLYSMRSAIKPISKTLFTITNRNGLK